jgi:hypothetical protein
MQVVSNSGLTGAAGVRLGSARFAIMQPPCLRDVFAARDSFST